ncbi:MAG: histidine phosphatase family protein [Candidatus Woesearchaeota archaeon]
MYHDVKNSESYENFKERVVNAFNRLIEHSKNEGLNTIAIVSHAGSIRCIIREIVKDKEHDKTMDDCEVIIIEKKKNNKWVISS